jgi:glucose/arabinose dehydrogenase
VVRTPLATPRRRRALHAAAVALATLALAGCTFGPPSDESGGGPPNLPRPTLSQSEQEPPSVVASVIAKNLDVPWGIAFLPDGGALVTERRGSILKVGPEIGDDGPIVAPVQTLNEAVANGEGGLLGIAVSPHYAADATVFVYYSTTTDNRIAKLTLGAAPQPILTGIPVASTDDGGQLAFGPDGFLYATTGDAEKPNLAQDPASLAGKILRMTTDGKPAPGNPFPNSLVYSSGHRDAQGLTWDAGGRLYATDLGQNLADEINRIEPGGNYGWPLAEGRTGKPGLTSPLQEWAPDVASCAGLAATGHLLVASCLRGQRLWLLHVTDGGTAIGAPTAVLIKQFGRLRAAVLAPDGSVWVSTSNRDGHGDPLPDDDKILRIVASEGSAISKV